MAELTENEELLNAQRAIWHLKDTVTALRDEMEALRARHDDDLAALESRRDAEARQLRETIAALRDQLEEAEERADEDLMDQERRVRGELDQLRETIQKLRTTLEARETEGA